MVGLCVKGGIGDAILATPLVKKIEELFNDKVAIAYFEPKATSIFKSTGCEDIRFIENDEFFPNITLKTLSDCKMIVFNYFTTDNDGHYSLFYAIDDSMLNLMRDRRSVFLDNLSRDFGYKISNMRDCTSHLLTSFSREDNYYADFNRFGIDVHHEDIYMEIPNEIVEKNGPKIGGLGDYCVFHDSRLADKQYSSKSWYVERWNELAEKVRLQYGLTIVHMKSIGQQTFSQCVGHEEIIGENCDFFDYLYLISRASLYVGTCSWPSISAIFLKKPKFIILRGPSVHRWDFGNKFSEIIRKGPCQYCQYTSLGCVFEKGKRTCMKNISVEDVMRSIKNFSKKKE